MKNGKSNSCLVTALKILGIIILIPIVIVFGWIAGVAWLLFFRKKINDNPEKQKKATIIVSVLSILSLIIMIFSGASYKPLRSIEISADVIGQELKVDQDYIIDVTYKPENASNSNFIYNTDSFCASFEKSGDDNSKAVLHTKREGTVTISVSCGTINSNFLNFTIVDDTKDTVSIDTENDGNDEKKEAKASEKSTSEDPPKVINDGIDVVFSKKVPNDVTGNWRLAHVSTSKEIQEYALDYYNAYFQSDNEIHAVINSSLNTTNKIRKLTSDTISVSVLDYVENEEHDANILFTGTPLKEYEINASTGEITKIPLESEAPEEANSDNADATTETASSDADTSAEPVNETESEAPSENTEMVWVSATGDKYHSIPNCGKMNPDKARQISKSDAEARGMQPCSKCH